MYSLIAFATGWGSQHGGINSFNTDFLSAFGAAYYGKVEVICIVPSATADEIEKARNEHVRLIPLPPPHDKTLSAHHAATTIAVLANQGILFDPESTVWLGHDRITGGAANAAAKAAGGRSALIHHMSYDRYESFAEDSDTAYAKHTEQRTLFRNADQLLAIGPLLRDALSDMVDDGKDIHMLVPGLAEITVKSLPKTFTVFLSGRLDHGASRIKQGHLGVAAFSHSHRLARELGMPEGLSTRPKLVLRGVDFESEHNGDPASGLAQMETELKKFAENYAGSVINLHALPYTHDRQILFDDLRSASVAMMPSWHEGFGLVGWEAIAAGVPLILSKESGLYRLLEEEYTGIGTGCVYPVDILATNSPPYFKEGDLHAVSELLRTIANKPEEAKRRAAHLRALLGGYSWTACAEQAVQAFGWTLQKGSIPPLTAQAAIPVLPPSLSLTVQLPVSTSPLQIPVKYWQRGQGIADSQLLRAEEELVPFDSARQPEVDKLNAWLDDSQFPQAVRLITGAGGVGKTRLALELCRRRGENGWHTGFLLADLEAREMASAWRTLRANDQPLLIVIDYAETRQGVLLALIKEILKERGTQPVRILLLARNGGEWWDNLPSRESACEPILCGYATTGPYDLSPLHPTGQNRHDAYRQALESFAAALGVAAPDVIPALEGDHFERPLYVQMAALLALHGERPTTAEGLTRALLNHERRYWRGILSTFGGGVEPEHYAQQLLAISTLAGGFSTAREAQSLVKAASLSPLPDGQFNALFNALAPLYPGKQGLQAVRPDLLGEGLIAHALLSPEAPHLLDAVLSNKANSTIRRHALTVLTRLAMQRDDLHETLIDALVRNFSHCYKEITEVAIETNGPLPILAEMAYRQLLPAIKSQISGTLEALLREESVQLATLSCLVTESSVNKCRKKFDKKPGCASTVLDYVTALSNHSVDLSRIGSTELSVSCAETALKYYEKLTPSLKLQFEPGLSVLLNNYANFLNDIGNNDGALFYGQKSLEICKRSADKNPNKYLSEYAMYLSNYSIYLSCSDNNYEALEYAKSSLNICKKIRRENPDIYEYEFALSLNNYSNRLCGIGDYEEAKIVNNNSLEIYGHLKQKNPDRYEPDYAMSLINYAHILIDDGCYDEAFAFSSNAYKIYMFLETKNSNRFKKYVLNSLLTIIFSKWLSSNLLSEANEISCFNELSSPPEHLQAYSFIYIFIQACQKIEENDRLVNFTQIISEWSSLPFTEKIKARPCWLCTAAWCSKYAPELVAELAWQSDLNKFASQKQGKLPKWMYTVAGRLDFSFDLSQVAVSQKVTSDEGEISCPSV